MVDDAIGGDRVIGMIQPSPTQPATGVPMDSAGQDKPELCEVGCLARITSFRESGDGRYFIVLDGICRFHSVEELPTTTLYRQLAVRYDGFEADLHPPGDSDEIDRDGLLAKFKLFLEKQRLTADWTEIERTPTEGLINTLTMSCPFEIGEKQALLEAPTLSDRADILMTLLQMAVAGTSAGTDTPLQ